MELKRAIPEAVRLSIYILIIATWVTIADMVMQAVVPDIPRALGAFVPVGFGRGGVTKRQAPGRGPPASSQIVGRQGIAGVGAEANARRGAHFQPASVWPRPCSWRHVEA